MGEANVEIAGYFPVSIRIPMQKETSEYIPIFSDHC